MKVYKYVCYPCNRRWYEPEQVPNERCRRCNAPAHCLNPDPIKESLGIDCLKVWISIQLLRLHCHNTNIFFLDFAEWAFGVQWNKMPMSELPDQWRALHKEFNTKVDIDNFFESMLHVLDMYYIKKRQL